MKPTVTPLRYPGGKTWLLGYVDKFILSLNDTPPVENIVEPFAGSASISVGLLLKNRVSHAYLCENDPLMVAFLDSLFHKNIEFQEMVTNLEINLETWFEFKKYLSADISKYSKLELATALLFYNRTNFSGIIKGGPIGGKKQLSKYRIDCRFNKEHILKKIGKLSNLDAKVTVTHGDGIEYISKHKELDKGTVFYVDPPYYNGGNVLYRTYFKEKEHRQLSDVLRNLREPWLLSYDRSEFIDSLYSYSLKKPIYTDYQANQLRRGVKEYLYSNNKIPPTAPHTTLAKSVKSPTFNYSKRYTV